MCRHCARPAMSFVGIEANTARCQLDANYMPEILEAGARSGLWRQPEIHRSGIFASNGELSQPLSIFGQCSHAQES